MRRKKLGWRDGAWLMADCISRGGGRPRCRHCEDVVDEIDECEIDHLTPLARGGADDLENMAIVCRDCNRAKGTQTQDEFRDEARGWN